MRKSFPLFLVTGFLMSLSGFAFDAKTEKAYSDEVHQCTLMLQDAEPYKEKVKKLCPRRSDPCDTPEVKELLKKRAAIFEASNDCLTAVHAKYKKLKEGQQAEEMARPLVEGRDYPVGAKPPSGRPVAPPAPGK